MTRKKEPLNIHIETGYMLSKLVKNSTKELKRIIEHVESGVDQMREKGDDIQDIQVAEIYERLYAAVSALHGAKTAHKVMSDSLQELGYRMITREDFAKYGVTGR